MLRLSALHLNTPPATERPERKALAVASKEHARAVEGLAGAGAVVVEVARAVGLEEAVAVAVAVVPVVFVASSVCRNRP